MDIAKMALWLAIVGAIVLFASKYASRAASHVSLPGS